MFRRRSFKPLLLRGSIYRSCVLHINVHVFVFVFICAHCNYPSIKNPCLRPKCSFYSSVVLDESEGPQGQHSSCFCGHHSQGMLRHDFEEIILRIRRILALSSSLEYCFLHQLVSQIRRVENKHILACF